MKTGIADLASPGAKPINISSKCLSSGCSTLETGVFLSVLAATSTQEERLMLSIQNSCLPTPVGRAAGKSSSPRPPVLHSESLKDLLKHISNWQFKRWTQIVDIFESRWLHFLPTSNLYFFSSEYISHEKFPNLAVQGESALWGVKGNISTSFHVCSQTFTDYVTLFLFILSPGEFLSPSGDEKQNISETTSRCLPFVDVFSMKLLLALSTGDNSSGWCYIKWCSPPCHSVSETSHQVSMGCVEKQPWHTSLLNHTAP